jgi:hypothetical protein
MPENERSEPTPEQIKYVLQQSILKNYPNPERKGCPGRGAIEGMAESDLPPDDPNWVHVTHCSPCYQEYLEIRARVLGERRARRRMRFVAVAAGVAGVGVVAAVLATRPAINTPAAPTGQVNAPPRPPASEPPAAAPVVTAVLNFESGSETRGEGSGQDRSELQRVPRNQVSLSIYLPLFSEAGAYEVRLLKSQSDSTPLQTFAATAELRDGLTVLQIKPDLSRFEQGTYVLAFRRPGTNWRYRRFRLS